MTNQPTAKDPLIHFPFYINQYQGLLVGYSFLEKGAFIALLCVYLSEDGKFPDDEDKLFRMAGAFSQNERKALSLVKNEVMRIGNDILKNQKPLRDEGRDRARKAALARWNRDASSNAPSNAPSIAQAMLKQCYTETETETETEIKKELKIYSTEVKQLTDGLKFVLEAKLNKKINSLSWKEEIRKLLEIDLKQRVDAVGDVKIAIQAIHDNFGEQYFPVVQSARALREKFTKIEAAIARGKASQVNSTMDIYQNLMQKYQKEEEENERLNQINAADEGSHFERAWKNQGRSLDKN